jgi:F-type H+-transporting ATPase subunit b
MVAGFVLAIGVAAAGSCALADEQALAAEKHAGAAAGDHSGEHEHIGLADPGPDVAKPEEIKSDLAFATFLVFLVLLAILWKFAWGPIIQAIERREQSIANHIAEAERSHDQAKALLAEYERKLAGAANDVRELLEEARRDAEHTKLEILAEAKTAAHAERDRSLREIEVATDQALKALAERSAELAVELAGKILQSKLTSADHARLIQEAVAKFPSAAASRN